MTRELESTSDPNVYSVKLVTVSGECIEIAFQRKTSKADVDGVFYLFHVKDLTKNRGTRLISLFRSGPSKIGIQHYDTRIENVRLNKIRRAFDIGILDFHSPYDAHFYKELLLDTNDFNPPPSAKPEQIQQCIVHQAYWLGFRYGRDPSYPVRFDTPINSEYLGANPAEIQRYVWLLGQRGLLEKVLEGMGRASGRLVEQYESSLSAPRSLSRPEQKLEWDVFISHASEDKDAIARPLAEALLSKGLNVWFDELSLTVGDSLRKKIDQGLGNSKFGIVILSSRFFEKHWPEQELNGLGTQEVGGRKVILPVWHGVNFSDVRKYSPTLADRLAVKTDRGLAVVVEELLAAMR